jgi:hypothetical protein
MGLIVSLITSPWAPPSIGFLGVLYLIFVGEPKEGKLRSRFWPYLAWMTIAVCATVVFIAFYTGYILENFGPRSLSDSERQAIKSALKLPEGINYFIGVEDDITCPDCGAFKSDIMDLISGIPGWHVTPGSVGGPGFRSYGLALVLHGITEGDSEVALVTKAFKAARIDLDIIHAGPDPLSAPCVLVVMPKVRR